MAEFEPQKDVKIDYDEPDLGLGERTESRIEDIWGNFPQVTTAPTWTPKKFNESIAVDTTNNLLYVYDFTDKAWFSTQTTFTEGYNVNIDTSTSPDTLNVGLISLTAGEAISADDAVVIGEKPTTPDLSYFTGYTITKILSNANFPSDNGLYAQTFQATEAYLHKIECEVQQDDLSTVTYQLQIQNTSGGAPGGTELGSATDTIIDTVNSLGSRYNATASFEFASPIQLTPGSTYAMVMRYSANTGASAPEWAYTNGNPYANGSEYIRSGGSWTAENSGNDEMSFKTYESSTIAGQLFKSNATSNNTLANNFIGFAPSAISAAASGNVVYMGVYGGFTGLVKGATYYLSNTSGQIGTTAGSQSRKIGIAISETQLLIKHDNS